jgi:hypothetical protein
LLPQKRTPSTLRTWGLEVCCLKSGFFSWAAVVGGWGAAQLGLVEAASSNAPNLFNASCWNVAVATDDQHDLDWRRQQRDWRPER